jgi:hypothetical protein
LNLNFFFYPFTIWGFIEKFKGKKEGKYEELVQPITQM